MRTPSTTRGPAPRRGEQARPGARGHRHVLAAVLAIALAALLAPPARGGEYEDTPPKRGGIGIGIGINLRCLLGGCDDEKKPGPGDEDAEHMARSGPQVPDAYSMSTLSMHGLVRGNAPFVYEGDAGEARLRIEFRVKGAEPYIYHVEGRGRLQKIFHLPGSWGEQPRAAVIDVRAVRPGGGAEVPAPFRLYALGMGEKAVGSVAIDQVSFGPPQVRIGRFGKARYSFLSRSDFNRVVSEFSRVEFKDGMVRVGGRVNAQDLGQVSRGEWVGRERPRIWDGKDGDGEVSQGLHLLTVRAWRSSIKEGDWVVSWSPDWVEIRW